MALLLDRSITTFSVRRATVEAAVDNPRMNSDGPLNDLRGRLTLTPHFHPTMFISLRPRISPVSRRARGQGQLIWCPGRPPFFAGGSTRK
ncbi:hypothetical protein PTI98_004309 [Pleurotus ostreatus]|nr:hypothetical protein PTI98_004309 [Pleurotus ostreatus]